MSIPGAILNQVVTVKRRVSSGIDSLGNPIYGSPTQTWTVIYTNVPVRLAFSSTPTEFSPAGERITPNGVVYMNPGYTILPEDRILVPNSSDVIEYNVVSVVPGYTFGTAVSHYEIVVQLP